jgi:hypothetical protein
MKKNTAAVFAAGLDGGLQGGVCPGEERGQARLRLLLRNKDLLSDRAKAENEKLTEKYGIRGFPTALILDGDGKKVGETGYRQGGAAEYVKHLKSFLKK